MGFSLLCSTDARVEALDRFIGISKVQASGRRFEVLRTVVWSLAAQTGKAHINRILSVGTPVWRVYSGTDDPHQESARAELRSALSTLQDTGDLIELKGGYWTPAAARLVELPSNAEWLLIGGIPTDRLPLDGQGPHLRGPYRHLDAPAASLASLLPAETLASWSRLPAYTSLQDWGDQVLASIERHPYSPVIHDSLEFYMPEHSRAAAPQFKRWHADAKNATGTLLARRTRAYGAREYRLLEVSAGRVIASGDLLGIDVRRLMYAYDLRAKNPVLARKVLTDTAPTWTLTSELPRAEQRQFSVFGSVISPEDRPFERRWTFECNEKLAVDMMRSLGIVTEQKNYKVRR